MHSAVLILSFCGANDSFLSNVSHDGELSSHELRLGVQSPGDPSPPSQSSLQREVSWTADQLLSSLILVAAVS